MSCASFCLHFHVNRCYLAPLDMVVRSFSTIQIPAENKRLHMISSNCVLAGHMRWTSFQPGTRSRPSNLTHTIIWLSKVQHILFGCRLSNDSQTAKTTNNRVGRDNRENEQVLYHFVCTFGHKKQQNGFEKLNRKLFSISERIAKQHPTKFLLS